MDLLKNDFDMFPHTVYRVYGYDSAIEGGYLTDTPYTNPIVARSDLALSQYDFHDENGCPLRNMASKMLEGTIWTDAENNIVDLEGNVTDKKLEFTTVEPTSDLPGGGSEFYLGELNFDQIVQVNEINELRHHSTPGWEAYVEIENNIINETNEEDIMNNFDDLYSGIYAEEGIDDLLSDDLYGIQAEDSNQFLNDIHQYEDIDPYDNTVESGIEDLWYDTLHEEQSIDTETSFWGDTADSDDIYWGRDENTREY